MTREEKRREVKNKKISIVLIISFILLFITSIFIVYNIVLLGPIEPIIRYIVIGLIVVLNIIKFKRLRKVSSDKKKKRNSIILNIFISIIFLFIGIFIYKFYNSIDSLSKNDNSYSSSLVVTVDSSITGIQDLYNNKLGMINDESSYEGYIIPSEVIDSNNIESDNDIITYDSYTYLLSALYSGKIDGAFLPSNYINMFSNISGYENINNDTKIVFTKTKTIKKKLSFSNKKIDKPITVLLTGIDSNIDGLSNTSSSNSDTLIVVTFNPDTLTATMLSIPRDSYVPISCFNGEKSKITHAGWQGVSCVENTIEDFLDIEIDYYVKLNFKGLVNLVDALGGIDVEVPQDLCTDSSDRTGKVCIKKGMQHLNGEEALVLARNRKQLAAGDIDRGLNQQIVIKGILNSVQNNITNVKALSNLLDSLSSNMDTNFTTEEILSFYNVGKDILRKSNKSATDSINIIQLFLAGSGAYIYDESTDMDLYYYILYKESVEKVSEAMNVNLETEEAELIKTFSWSIDEDYVHVPFGKNIDDFTRLYYTGSYTKKDIEKDKEEEKEIEEEDITLDDSVDIDMSDDTTSDSSDIDMGDDTTSDSSDIDESLEEDEDPLEENIIPTP